MIHLRDALEQRGNTIPNIEGWFCFFFLALRKHPKETNFQNYFINRFLGQSKIKM
jgi:hypothetical protein